MTQDLRPLNEEDEQESESSRTPFFTDKLNALIIDDDVVVLRATEKDLGQLEGEFGQITSMKDAQEALALLRTRQADDFRQAIHVVLSDLNIGSTDQGVELLREMEKLSPRPYTIIYSGYTRDVTELDDLGHQVIPKEEFHLPEKIKRSMPRIRAYLGQYISDSESNEEGELLDKFFVHAKNSPLPLIKLAPFNPERDNHNLLEAMKRPAYWLAILDLDNTLYEAESKHSIMLHHFAEFMLNKSGHPFGKEHGGNRDALEQLVQECREWEEERYLTSKNIDVPNARTYKQGIKQTGEMSAAAFRGMRIEDLRDKYGRQFIAEHFLEKGKLFEYVPSMIKELLDHGIMPVLVTGTPDFLVPHILPKTGINFGQGMTYKVRNGRLTGDVEVNMGLEKEKANFVERLTRRGYAPALAVGDSESDKGPFQCTVFKGESKWDVSGAAVLVNASDEAVSTIESEYARLIGGEDARVFIVKGKEPSTKTVMADISSAIEKVFDPMHDYLSVRQDSEHPDRDRFLADLEAMRQEGKKIDNIENIKRIRDILERQGLPKEDVMEVLLEFYPEIVVDDAVKSDVVNMRIEDDLEAYLLRIGVCRESVDEVLAKNRTYQEEKGSIPPVRKHRSTMPPPPDSTEEMPPSSRASIDSAPPSAPGVSYDQPTSDFEQRGVVDDPIAKEEGAKEEHKEEES